MIIEQRMSPVSKLEKMYKSIKLGLCEKYPKFNALIKLVKEGTEIYPCTDDNVLFLLTELGYSKSTILKLKGNHSRVCEFIGTDPGWLQNFRFLVFQYRTQETFLKNESLESMLVCHLKEQNWSFMFSSLEKAIDKLLKECLENESLVTDFRIVYSDMLAGTGTQIIGPESIRDDILYSCLIMTALTWMLRDVMT